MASNSRQDKLKRRPYSYGKSEEADESRLGTTVPCPYNGKMRFWLGRVCLRWAG
jgi:hypothetical protein